MVPAKQFQDDVKGGPDALNQNRRPIPDDDSQPEAFERYRPYLTMLARQAVPGPMRARVDPSDLVQQTIAEAWRCQEKYRGDSATHLPWLRGILTRVAAANMRHHLGVEARDAKREVSVGELMGRTDASLDAIVAASSLGPASAAERNEQVLRLASAIESLSEDHRNILIWRHFEDLSHKEIAARLGKSEAATRMQWLRALKALKVAFEAGPDAETTQPGNEG